jgi:hypothetical protein
MSRWTLTVFLSSHASKWDVSVKDVPAIGVFVSVYSSSPDYREGVDVIDREIGMGPGRVNP